MKQPREVHIIPVLNGFVCRVDCQTVVFKDKATMLIALSDYYDNPDVVEKQFIAGAINKTLQNQEYCGTAISEPANQAIRAPKRPF